MPTEPVQSHPSTVQFPADSTPPSKNGDRNLSGVRGWLLGFCLVLTIIAPLYLISGIVEEFDVGKRLSDRVPGLHLLVQLEAVVSIVLLIFSLYAGYLMWAVKPRAVLTAKIFLGAMFVVTLFSGPILGLVAGVDDNSMAILWNRVPNSASRAALWFLPLYGYLRLSKRVRATYGPA